MVDCGVFNAHNDMSAPPTKPWERVGVNNLSQNGGSTMSNQMSSSLPPAPGEGGSLDSVRPVTSALSRTPPNVPTRPSLQNATMPYGGIGSMYGGGMGGYGGYNSMHSPYGSSMYSGSMYGGGYGSYNMNSFGNNYSTNSFAQMAQENSRQAFQSIEGIVQAFGAVAMMLESTYSAVYNSFRAVIGVADHFSRMRSHFTQMFSAFAVIKSLRWLVRKLLILLRLQDKVPDDVLWSEASKLCEESVAGLPRVKKPGTSWPLLLFFAVILGGPWLIWRFLTSLSSRPGMGSGWSTGDEDHFVALAEFDFDGEKDDELSLRRGQRINVAPKELQPRMRGWLLASVDSKVGIIPANYVKILGKRRGTKSSARVQHQNDTTSPPSGEMSTAAPSQSANVGISQKLQKPNERSGDDLQVDPIEAAFYQNNGDPHCPDPINTQPGQFNSGKTRLSDQAKPDMLDSDSGNFEDNW